jgi:CelD/BcsL family acetyltransferase involved in cellulose biosynthesis
MMLETKTLCDRGTIDALAPDWDALVHEIPGTFQGIDGTMSFAWFDAIRASFPQATSPTVITCHSDGKLAGLLPLIPMQSGPLGTQYALPTELYGGRSGPLLPNNGNAPQILSALLFECKRNLGGWSSVRISIPEGPLAQQFRRAAQVVGLSLAEQELTSTLGFPMPPGFNADHKDLSSNRRQHLRKAQNKIKRLNHQIRFRVFNDEVEAEELLATVLKIERSTWKHETGTAITNHPQQQLFYSALFPFALRSGILYAAVLYLDEQPVAHHFGLLHNNVFCCLKHSHIQQHDELSPSALLMAAMFEDLSKRGAQSFDWMGVSEIHKTRWSQFNINYHCVRFNLFSQTPRGMLASALFRIRKNIRSKRTDKQGSSLPEQLPNTP